MKIKAQQYLKPIRLIIEKSGANFLQVSQLVDLRLLLDNRKTVVTASGRKKDPSRALVRQSLFFLLFGTLIGLYIQKAPDTFSFFLIANSYLMVMLAVSMLSEYSVSLFDTRDNQLILPLPLSGATLGWARLIHILVYLLLVWLSLSLPLYLIAGFRYGFPTLILGLISGLLNTFFTLFLTVFLYLGLMRFTSGEKMKDLLMYIQVGFSILIMLGYQFLSREYLSNMQTDLGDPGNAFLLLIPPVWFSMLPHLPYSWVPLTVAGSLMALVIPIGSAVFIARIFFKGYGAILTDMQTTSAPRGKTATRLKNRFSPWGSLNRALFGIKRHEFPLFQFIWTLSGRERVFKQSVLPLLGYTLVLPLVMLFTQKEMNDKSMQYQIFMYFTVMISSSLPTMINLGNSPYTGWIFTMMPHLAAHRLFLLSMKAVFGKFFFPVFLVMAIPLFWFKGFMALPSLIVLFAFNYAISLLVLSYQQPLFPFSQIKSASQGGKTMLRMMVVIFLALPMGFLQFYLSSQNQWLALCPLILLFPLILYIERRKLKRKFSWEAVELANQ